jgi:hypothetical protein
LFGYQTPEWSVKALRGIVEPARIAAAQANQLERIQKSELAAVSEPQ